LRSHQEKKNNDPSTAEIKHDDTQQPDITILPPAIQSVLRGGLLETTPTNGKYAKRAGTKDKYIIKWIVDHSGYEDTLTADLYIQYIHTDLKPQTIGQYISASMNEGK
jgi:hypothetical protein